MLEPERLSRPARAALRGLEAGERVGLAAISLKEAAWHLAHKRITVNAPMDWGEWLRLAALDPRLETLPLTVDVAIDSERFPESFPADPADRLIAATARVHGLVLITADRPLRESDAVRTLW